MLNARQVESIAREAKFVQRTSKLNGIRFSRLMIFSGGNISDTSLEELCHEFKYLFGKNLEKQSLNERINEFAVNFFKLLLEEVLARNLNLSGFKDLLPNQKRIRIKDSTSFQVPEHLKDLYPGSGGKTSKACLKIQFEYDLKTGEVMELSVGSFTNSDLNNSYQTAESIEDSDLLIRDLGYISLEFLETIESKLAYYLNRIRSNVNIYQKDTNGRFVPLNQEKIERKMRRLKIQTMGFEVYLGEEKKVKSRVIIEILPKDVIEEKLRKAKRAAQREGRELGKDTISRIGLNIFVTNLSEEDLPNEMVRSLYRLRWQVELVFKVWKSLAKIDQTKKDVKRERLECHLYGKLIWVFLGWGIFWKLTEIIKDKIRWLSFYKMMKNLRTLSQRLITQSGNISRNIRMLIKMFIEEVMKKCRLEEKNKSLSSIEIIMQLIKI